MSQITPDDLRLLMSGIGDKYYTASRNIESWVTLRIPVECKPVLDDALKLAYNLVRCKDCKYWDRNDPAGNGCECSCNGGWWLPEDYCSCGERREKE